MKVAGVGRLDCRVNQTIAGGNLSQGNSPQLVAQRPNGLSGILMAGPGLMVRRPAIGAYRQDRAGRPAAVGWAGNRSAVSAVEQGWGR